jgi:hypothetical protein
MDESGATPAVGLPGPPLPSCSILPVGTVRDGADWQQQHPSWLLRALHESSIVDRPDQRSYAISVHPIGSIPLPTGQLVACDPYLVQAAQPAFLQPVPAGDHPVLVAMATITDDQRRTLAALVLLGTDPLPAVTSWQLGRTEEATGDPLAIGEFVGFPVDAGTGCFAGPAAIDDLLVAMAQDEGMLEDRLSTALELSPLEAAVASPQPGGPAVAAFRSGWGDGAYPTWIGLSADGRPVLAMTDFLLFTDPWEPADEPADSPARPVITAAHVAVADAGRQDERQSAARDHSDYAGRITAAEAAAAQRPIKPGFWSRLVGR